MSSAAQTVTSTPPRTPKLWKKASLDWLNRPKQVRSKPSSSTLRVNLPFTTKESGSESEGSPPTRSTGELADVPPAAGVSATSAASDSQRMSTLRALTSPEVLIRMLDDPKCLWKFGQFVSYDVSAETLIFYLNAEQHRQDFERLLALTRRVHGLHVPTSATLALNISAAERTQLDRDSMAFLQLEDPFAVARKAALEQMLRDSWPRFLFHRLELLHEMEMRTMEAKSAFVNLASSFCISSADPADDFAMLAISDGFSEITGYSRSDAIGRNCRFLQGPGTDSNAVERLSLAVRNNAIATVLILNYRKDGAPFQNFIRVIPLRDADGKTVAYLGYQVNLESRDGLGSLLDDRLDVIDERLPAGVCKGATKVQQDQQKHAVAAFTNHIESTKPQPENTVTRELRLSEAAMLTFGHTARVADRTAPGTGRSNVSSPMTHVRSPSMASRQPSRPASTSRPASSSTKRRSMTSDVMSEHSVSDHFEQLSIMEDGLSPTGELTKAICQWLYLDATGNIILHACARMSALYRPGTELGPLVKAANSSLLKRIKHVAKSGESVRERGRIALSSSDPLKLSDVVLAFTPLKGKDDKVAGIICLITSSE